MLTIKEISSIIIVTIVLSAMLSFTTSINIFLISLISVFLVIIINIATKKLTSFYLDSEMENEIWSLKRPGTLFLINPFSVFFRSHPTHKYKNPVYIGAILPLITGIITIGNFVWMACLTFDVKPKPYRTAKRFGLYSFSEMTESHIGLIAASGIAANLFFAVIGYLIGFPEFARINIYYAVFNMLPLSELDGNKIFFGNTILWSLLASITLVALGYAMLLV